MRRCAHRHERSSLLGTERDLQRSRGEPTEVASLRVHSFCHQLLVATLDSDVDLCEWVDMSEDVLFLDSLSLEYPCLSPSAWPTPSYLPRTLLVHAELYPPDPAGFASAAETDSLDGSTLSYAVVAQAFARHLAADQSYTTAAQLAEALAEVALECGASTVNLRLELPRAVLHAESGSVCVTRPSQERLDDCSIVTNLRVACIIGVLPHEREETQTVRIDLTCWPESEGMNLRRLAKTVTEVSRSSCNATRRAHSAQHVSTSRFQTVEALASSIATTGLAPSSAIRRISVRVSKPSAIPNASGAGCQITRERSSRPELRRFSTGPASFSRPPSQSPSGLHTVYLALGSNMGSRLANLDRALHELSKPVEAGGAAATVQDVSFAYETEPMFVDDDHPDYLNAACKVRALLLIRSLAQWRSDVHATAAARASGRGQEGRVGDGQAPDGEEDAAADRPRHSLL